MATQPKPAAAPPPDSTRRCGWGTSTPEYLRYHDREWGVPVHDDRRLFEFLILEGAQAGLSWLTILRKRAAYRRAFDGFDPRKVARYDRRRIAKLLQDEGIVRNRLKIESAISNARAFLAVQQEFGSFDRYVWGFVGGAPKQNARKSLREIPPRTPESDALSRDLKQRGFRFVGSTICYAFMQAVGLVNDHLVTCFRYRKLAPKARRARGRSIPGR
ncbi:MAG: DNA-3-methyladenine glycosylase I [Deltaproteobacteria bacterium]|nr:MAG: DNA-3-methyladenine glycosylase I [Deltaproteobacteria bacterium]